MKKTLRFLLLLILPMLLSAQAIAQESLVPAMNSLEGIRLEAELKEEAEFIKLMLQVGEQIDREASPTEEIFNNPQKMAKILQSKMEIYHHYFEQSLKIPAEKKGIFKKYFLALKWENIVPVFKKAHMGMEVFFKKKGPGVAIAIMAGFAAKFSLVYILTSVGLAKFIPILALIPLPVYFSFIPSYLNKLKVKKMLIEELGGEIQAESYLKQEKNLLKHLHMKGPNDLLLPIAEEGALIKSVVIQKETLKTSVLERLGFNKDALNLNTMQTFLAENNISDPYLDWIKTAEHIDKEMKVSLMVNHIFSMGNKSVEESFQNQFSEKILLLKGNKNWEEALNWMQDMKKAQSLDEIISKVDETPASLHPKEVAIIWETYLLPEYIENFHIGYTKERAMFTEFESLKALLNTTESSSLDEGTKNKIFTYLKKVSNGDKFHGCENTPMKINQYLLR